MKLVYAALLTTGILCAQPQPQAPDPPSRVARLNFINGAVSFQPASLDTWTAATLNYPLTTGDHLYTDVGSLAEMHVGPNAIRMNDRSNFGFLNLDDRTVQMRFTEGAMEVRLRALDDQDLYEVDTPNGAISLLRTGDYRIDTYPDRNATLISVFSGEVEVTANGTSFPVHAGGTAYFTDGPPDVRGINAPDEFDRFTADRNMQEERLPPPQHVPRTMVGYEDLNTYGSWRNVPPYGWVWAPPVQAGWAPYHNGHWAWVEPWGWTWIDDAPWGFAPFHYGRWAFAGGAWVWVPGAVVARPVYAPALVAFVGGPRFGLSIGIGGGAGAVAWFPLGPQEVYRPAYAVSNAYITSVNITHVTNVTVINNVNVTNVRYVNQNVAGAVTAVPQNAFATARPVAAASIRVPPQAMAQAQVMGAAPQVAPQRESLLGPNANANVARPPAGLMSRQVMAKATPPPPPVSFQAKQVALAQNAGRPLAPEQVAQIRQQQPAAVANGAAVRSAAATAPAPGVPPGVQTRPANRFDSRPPGVAGSAPALQNPVNQPRPAERTATPAPAAAPRPAAAESRPQPGAQQSAEKSPAAKSSKPAAKKPAPKRDEKDEKR